MRLKLTLITLLCAISMQAQTYTISGRTVDGKSQPVDMAAVRLMKGDSTFVSGQSTDSAGVFQFELKEAGEYILQFSFIGFNTQYRHVSLTAKKPHVSLGDIKLSTNDRLLSEATVTGHAAQVAIKEDTFVYNASAYRTPEGSTLEALVEKLPGAEVGDDGSIKINGKTVTQILVDGKDFFKGDTKVAMKNLPVDMVDKLKSYDKQSDYAKQTGIDDGNEETVLDVNMKQKLKSSWISNIDLAAGNHDRYSSNLFLNRFTDNTRITAFGSLNNTHDQRFRGGGPGFRGGGGGGLTASKMAGIDGFWNNGLNEDSAHYFEIGGNIRLSHSNSDHLTRSNSETFLSSSTASSFANSASHTYSKSSNINLEMNLSWKPDSMTWFRFRPSYSHTSSNSDGSSRSVTFNSDPYDIDGMTNPLDSMFQVNIPTSLTDIAVNRNNRLSLSDSKSDNWQGEFNLTRRLNRKGRSLSLRGQAGYTHSSSHSFSLSDIYYYQTTRTNGAHESYNNQYSLAPSTSWNYSARFSYSEPLFSHWFFQGSYEYEHKYSDRDRSLYQLDSLRDWGVGTNHPFGTLPSGDSLNIVKNLENSQYATYKDDIHTINLGFRYVTKELNFHVGVRLQPQRTELNYQKNLLDTVVTRNVFNIAPDLRMRYRFNQFTRLDFRYRGSSSQPSMTNLLDITDTSDPLNISKGNPGLKPSWSNNFDLFFNTYQQTHQQSVFTRVTFTQTSNSISSAVTYDETTGVRTTQPQNINGNWSTTAFVGWNRAFGADNQFGLNTGTNVGYYHSVGYMSVSGASSQKNTLKTLDLGERLRATYRTDALEIGLNGSINYSKSRSKLQSQSNLETFTFAYGGNLQYSFNWGMSLATDISMNSRRGYDDASMNTNELIWNAQLSQSFLKKALTLSVQFYDILHEQSNISRTINAQLRLDTWSNAINSYFMVHLIYRLNFFGGNNGRIRMDGDRRRGPGNGPGMGPGMGPGFGRGMGGRM